MTTTAIPTRDTRPTDARDGRSIDPTRVECPYCERTGVVEDTVLLCHGCGRWFEVAEEGDR